MLTALRIKNLALVADLTLELRPGLCVITGETGAGKSVILGALDLVLGQRADRTAIRSGADACAVEAVLDVRGLRAPLGAFLDENGLEPCDDGQLVLKRTFTAAGTNRQFVNGSPTTLATLAVLGEWLVDLHGPHEHQSLLQPAKQLAILDAFGGLGPERDAFAALVRRRAGIEAEKAALIVDERTYAQQLDLLRFQVREITEARLRPGEAEEIEAEFNRASNAAKLLGLSQAALGALGEDDDALLVRLGALGRVLQDLHRLDPAAAPLTDAQGQAASVLRELQADLARYADKIEVDPARLAEVEARLDLIHSLQRKHGGSLAEVIETGARAAEKLAALEGRDQEVARLDTALARLDAELDAAGRALSAGRKKLVPRLSKAVRPIALARVDRTSERPSTGSCGSPVSPPGARGRLGTPMQRPSVAARLSTTQAVPASR